MSNQNNSIIKKIFISFFFVLLIAAPFYSFAQHGKKDSANLHIKIWQLNNEDFTAKKYIPVDTTLRLYEIYNPLLVSHISMAWLGNLGSSGQSNILAEQIPNMSNEFIFSNNIDDYMLRPEKTTYYNTNKHFTSLYYCSNFQSASENSCLRVLHTQNITDKLNFGLRFNNVSAVGEYANQKTKHYAFEFFTSYENDRYAMNLSASTNILKMQENGGILDTAVTSSKEYYPVYLSSPNPTTSNAVTVTSNQNFFFTQTFKIGELSTFSKEDTTYYRLVRPWFTIGHSFLYERYSRVYYDNFSSTNPPPSFYPNVYYDTLASRDSIYYSRFVNKIQIKISDNIIPHFKVGLKAALGNEMLYYFDFKQYLLLNNNYSKTRNFSELSLYNENSTTYQWLVNYKKYFGEAESDLNAHFEQSINILGDTLMLFNADYRQIDKAPSFWEQQYYSNRIQWTNDFADKKITTLSFKLRSPRWDLIAGFTYSDLKNMIVFGDNALPEQIGKNIYVYNFYLEKELSVGGVHFLNRINYQKISDTTVIKLPALSLFSSLFYQNEFFHRALITEIGADLYYNSTSAQLSYMPSTGQFYYPKNAAVVKSQPYYDVFLNFRVKDMRIMIKLEQLNDYFANQNQFILTHYPLAGHAIKLGFLWLFND